MDYVGPAVGALLFVAGMSLVAEPTRLALNAIILAGASGVYLSGGLGLWELTCPVIGAAIAFSRATVLDGIASQLDDDVDVVFNNAGYGMAGPLEGVTDEPMLRMVHTPT